MSGDIDILHHVGIITADMPALIARYERLGFVFTALSMPRIVLRPGGEPELLGAGNRCAIFRNNYLEILAVIDRPRWDQITREQRGPFDIDPPLARYQGLHVVHFGADDLDVTRARLLKEGTPASDIRLFQRNVDTPTGPQMMKARTLFFPGSDLPSLTQAAQHLTPELVLQPRDMAHPNGAVSITETIFCANRPAELANRYARLSGHKVVAKGDLHLIDLGHSRLIFVAPEHLEGIIPGAVPPVLPFIAGFTVATSDLGLARKVLAEGGISFSERDGRLIAPPQEACGAAVLFETEGRLR